MRIMAGGQEVITMATEGVTTTDIVMDIIMATTGVTARVQERVIVQDSEVTQIMFIETEVTV